MSAGGRAVVGTLGVGDDDLVTGDAVALRLPTASAPLRILSGLIDVGVQTALLVGAMVALFGLLESLDEALGAALTLVLSVLVIVVLPVVVERATGGRSLGRLVTGTCVVRTDGGPVTTRQCVTRALVGVLEIWMTSGAVAIVAVVVSPRGQRLGDLAAGTCCVRDRLRLVLPAPVPPVPELEGWARAADIAPLPDDLALAARSFLHRRAQFAPEARARMAHEVATDLASRVSPAPPAGTHPEVFVQAVLAERARRDAERLGRDDALRRRLGLA